MPAQSFTNYPSVGVQSGGYVSEIMNTDLNGSSQPTWNSSGQRSLMQPQMNQNMDNIIQLTFRIPRQDYRQQSQKEMPVEMTINTQLLVDLLHQLHKSHGNQQYTPEKLAPIQSNSSN